MTGVAVEAQAASAVNLCKTYGAGHAIVRALDNVSVAFERGRFTAVMGPSGSGKSTLMHCLAGLDRPTSGTVFQYFNLVPTLTAGENITLPIALAGRKPDQAWVGSLTRQLGIADRLTHRPSELSGGQQQRGHVRQGAGQQAGPRLRGRANGQPGLQRLGGPPHVPPAVGAGTWPVGRHGDPRPAQRRVRGAARVIFLAGGAVVSELREPTADSVLERMRTLGE